MGGDSEVDRLRSRLERERRARTEAERIAEHSTRELYARQRDLELLHRVAEAANLARRIEEAIEVAIEAVCDHTGWPVGHAYLVDPDANELRSSGIWRLPTDERYRAFREVSERIGFEPGVGLPGRVYESGAPVWIVDIGDDPNFSRRELLDEELPLRGAVAFPASSGGTIFAVLEFFQPRWIEPDEDLIELLGSVGRQLGRVLERDRIDRVQQEARRLATLVDASNDAIIGKDLEGTVISWNRGAQRLYGYHREEMIGSSLLKIFPPGREAELDEILARVADGESVEHYEAVRVAKDGTEVEVEVNAAPVIDDEGRVVGACAVGRDIGARRAAERKLAARARELEEVNEELKEFAYIASHDLAEPLRTISGFVQLLKKRYEGQLDDEADRYIDFAVRGAERMHALIGGLLAYSRLGRAELVAEPLEVGSVVARVEESLAASLKETGAELVAEADLPTVWGDRSQLERLFANLIGNAIKFSVDGEEPRVAISAERDGPMWSFCVADNGIGIAEPDAESVFRVFHRLHSVEDYPGAGIGLAICRKIVERHGGRIWAVPGADGGTEMRFTLPAEEPEELPE